MSDHHRPLPELLALLCQALADAPTGELTQADTTAETADRTLHASLEGSTQDTANNARATSTAGREHLEAAQAHLAVFCDELRAYYSDLSGSPPETSATATAAPPTLEPPVPTTEAAAVRQGPAEAAFDPGALLGEMPPFERRRGRGERSKTHGRWVEAPDEQARCLRSGEKLANGKPDPAFLKVKEKMYELELAAPPWVPMTASHVELKFAVQMQPGQRANVVINNVDGPCPEFYGCDNQLPNFLPPDAELTVHWPGNNQKTYRGSPKP